MLSQLKVYATCFCALGVVDFIWIAVFMKRFYVESLKPIGRISGDSFEPVLWAAVLVYVVLTLGIVHLALPRLESGASFLSSFGIGALLGFVIYATYDFTNYSTLKDYRLSMTFIDIAWGTILCGLVTLLARFVRDV